MRNRLSMTCRIAARGLGFSLALLALVFARASLAGPCQDRFCAIDDAKQAALRQIPPEQRLRELVEAHGLPTFSTRRGVPVVAIPKALTAAPPVSGSSTTPYLYYTPPLPSYTETSKDYLTRLSPNVVEFTASSHHLYTRVGDQSYDNILSLNARPWRPATEDRLSVLVQLTDSEMGRLQQWIDRAARDHDGTLGPFCYAGGDPNAPGSAKRSNCTSWISCARVGDHGETIGQLVGVGGAVEPCSFVSGMASNGSGRVKAIIVHSPDPQQQFNQGYLDGVYRRLFSGR